MRVAWYRVAFVTRVTGKLVRPGMNRAAEQRKHRIDRQNRGPECFRLVPWPDHRYLTYDRKK